MLHVGIAKAADASKSSTLYDDLWERIELDPTGCAFETPFSIFFREGSDNSKLLIYFQGGGACWNWVSCSGLFDSTVEQSELSGYAGIFDFSQPSNPFRDFTILFVPYCTGDVHVGDSVRSYGDDRAGKPVKHQGRSNVNKALDWVQSRTKKVNSVVVAGTSAGSYGAIFHAPNITNRYPTADIVVIGDSGVPLLHNYEVALESWGVGSSSDERENIGDSLRALETWYLNAARPATVRKIAQITSDQDRLQFAFYLVSGSPGSRAASYELLNRMEDEIGKMRSFIVDGDDHGLLNTNRLYDYSAGGVLLTDWIEQLIGGSDIPSMRCQLCSTDDQ